MNQNLTISQDYIDSQILTSQQYLKEISHSFQEGKLQTFMQSIIPDGWEELFHQGGWDPD